MDEKKNDLTAASIIESHSSIVSVLGFFMVTVINTERLGFLKKFEVQNSYLELGILELIISF